MTARKNNVYYMRYITVLVDISDAKRPADFLYARTFEPAQQKLSQTNPR